MCVQEISATVQLNKRRDWSICSKISQCFIIIKFTAGAARSIIPFESLNTRNNLKYKNNRHLYIILGESKSDIAALDYQSDNIRSPPLPLYPDRPNTLRALKVVARATSSGVLFRYAAIISTVTGREHGSLRWNRENVYISFMGHANM